MVGLGRWGGVLLESVQRKSTTVRFGAVVTRSPDKHADRAAREAMTVLGSLEEALAQPDIDGIVLATPHSQHAAQILLCAAAGKPVFVEKPFTMTRASAAQALAAAERAGIVVAAGHNRRFLPAMRTLKQAVDDGRLGSLLFMEANMSSDVSRRYTADLWRVAPGESPAGGMAGAGIHLIDTMIHLAGPIREAQAWSSRRVLEVPMDDTTAALFTFASSARASLTTIMATAPTFRFQVFGTGGSAELRGRDSLAFVALDGQRDRHDFPPFDMEQAELEAFAAAIRGEAPYPVAPDEILNGVAAFEAVVRSAEIGQPVAVA